LSFNIGDTVTHTQGKGAIVYGPFLGLSNFEPRYLIKKENGEHFTGGESYLTPVSKFEVGQKVTFEYSPEGESFEVMAGPFKDFEGDVFWVVRDSKGADDMAYETHMVPVVE
jgi:hypothetical protein